MPIWLIELFGARDLQLAFIAIMLMTMPVWLAMIFMPSQRWVRRLAAPLVVSPLYALVLVFLVWKAYEASLTPAPVESVTYDEARDFLRHPITFLVFLCNLQVLNLCLGTLIYQKARRNGIKAPVELVLCWLLGAVGAIPFVIRLMLKRKSLE